MRTVIVTSTHPYAGKSGICLALLSELASRGVSAGYFKPYGTMPVTVDGVLTDQDARYINGTLPEPGPPEAVCPVVETRGTIERVMTGEEASPAETVRRAFEAVSAGRQVMVVEGPDDVFQGRSLDLSVCQLAELLDARVLIVDHVRGVCFPDDMLGAQDCLGHRAAGVILNQVHESYEGFVREHLVPFLGRRGLHVYGCLPRDPALSSVTVAEIVEALQGTVLCAEDRLDEPVESFMVGAMGQEQALTFFRRRGRKAVVTGGDRADVQLAALETDTKAVILTGDMPPTSLVLARADELGVPMIQVDMDTLTAVERMESLLGRTRLHDPAKAGRIREMFAREVEVDRLLTDLALL